MSSCAGNFSQKSRSPKENPPLAPPTYPNPEACPPPPHGDPAVALRGALAEREAVGGELGEGVVAPLGDVLEAARDALVPGGGIGQFPARVLGRLDGRARVAAKSRDALNRLAQHAGSLATDADVAVVGRVPHRHGEADAEPADEVAARLARFHRAVEGDRVHHAEGVGARVEVEADRERQPTPAALTVFAVDAHDGADRAVLLYGDLADHAVEALGLHRALILVLDLGLADEDELGRSWRSPSSRARPT